VESIDFTTFREVMTGDAAVEMDMSCSMVIPELDADKASMDTSKPDEPDPVTSLM
jgi:hypothetical protein